MNILILNPILYSGNGNNLPKVESIKDTMIYGMCLGFKALGHSVTLVAMEEYRPTKKETYDFEVLFFRNNLLNISHIALPYSFKLYKYIKKEHDNFDMILSSEIFSFHTLFAAQIAPYKTIVWQEVNAHQRKLHQIPSKFWHKMIVPRFFQNIRCVVCRSISAQFFISKYIKNVASETVDHGIDINKFKITHKKKDQFISVAQLIHRKNISGIISKFYDFIKNKKYSHYKLLIAGRGPMEKELHKQVESLGIKNNVIFLGFLNHIDLNHYIAQSKAFLVNTNQDLNMVSIPESIVSGTPILTNMVPALAQYINENRLGIAKSNWDAKDMIQIVEEDSYSTHCIEHRNKLSNKNSAQCLIDIFNNHKIDR